MDAQLKQCVEKLTTDGKTELNSTLLRQLKNLCKNGGDSAVLLALRALVSQLNAKHSQIRFSTLLAINELFQRSHSFRSSFLESGQFQEFLDLTLGINERKPLPPPKRSAKLLKTKCIEILNEWNNSYAGGYPILKNSYAYLRDNKVVDFRDREVVPFLEREAKEKETEKRNRFLKAKIEKTVKLFNELEEDMKFIFTQYENCLQLIVPKLSVDEDNCSVPNVNCSVSENGIIDGINQSFDLTIKPIMIVNKNEDNGVLVDNLKDMYKQFIEFLSKIKKLLQIMSKGSEFCYNEMKKAIDLKSKIMGAIQKFIELKVVEPESVNGQESSDTSDEDFETVEEKEDIELIIPQNRRKEYGLDDEPTKNDLEQPSTSGISKFTECRAPLSNGKLCPRRDKIKCPFHGKIIVRDSCGIPVNEEDRKRESKMKAEATPDWQQPELLRDIESQTGIDLRVSRKGKGKRKKYPGLENINTCEQTSRQRLAKKVFSVESQRKVADDLKEMDAKLSNKFGDQWNYFMNE